MLGTQFESAPTDSAASAIVLQPDGKILAAGYSRDRDRYFLAIARILN